MRLFKTRLNEHKKDVQNAQKEQYIRSVKKQAQSSTNNSALTDYATTNNHLMDWLTESDRRRRLVKLPHV